MVSHNESSIVFTAYQRFERLDLFVEDCCPWLSRSRCNHLIRGGFVLLNGEVAKPSRSVQVTDSIQVTIPIPENPALIPQWMPLGVIYESVDILVLDKPAGMTVHPGPGHPDRTLVNALLERIPGLMGVGGVERPGIVHRLDRQTSGLIAVAKTSEAYVSLTRQLKERTVRKTYIALTSGSIAQDNGKINAPIARNPRHRQRMAIVPGGRNALTHFKVIARVPGHSLVEVYPETGRTHQIRVHFASIGHPLIGDGLYGRGKTMAPLDKGRHFLHATGLSFWLPPQETEWADFRSELAPDLAAVLSNLGLI